MFKNLFNKKEPEMVVTEDYKKWRKITFSMKADKVGFTSTEPGKVYGMNMNIGIVDQKANATFAFSTTVFANGEAAFMPTPGGGFMGLGRNPQVAEVAKSIVTMGQIFLVKAQPAKDYPLPATGDVIFYFFTTSGLFFIGDKLSAFQAGPYNQLLTKFGQIRGVAERMIDQRKK